MNLSDPLGAVLERLPAELGPPEGDPVPLEGGITNRNYRMRLGGRDCVLRLPGKDTGALGIDRAAEEEAGRLAARLGIGPEVLVRLSDPDVIVTRLLPGRALTAVEVRDPAHIERVAWCLRRLHDSGAALRARFDVFRVVEDHAEQARARGAEIPGAYAEAHAWARRIEAALTGPDHEPVPIHADLLAANLIELPGGFLRIVDWEYAGMGHRFFDLGNVAVNNEFGPEEEDRLLHAYFSEDPGPARRAALVLFRALSDFREAMWGVVQGAVSALDVDFPAYADKHFARLHATLAAPEFARALEEASGAPA